MRKHRVEAQQAIRGLERTELRRIVEIKGNDERRHHAARESHRCHRRSCAAMLPQPPERERQQQEEIGARRNRHSPERPGDVGMNRARQPPQSKRNVNRVRSMTGAGDDLMEHRGTHREDQPTQLQRCSVIDLFPDGEKKRRQPEEVLKRAGAGDHEGSSKDECTGQLMQDVAEVGSLGIGRTARHDRPRACIVRIVIIASQARCVNVHRRVEHREHDDDDRQRAEGKREKSAPRMWEVEARRRCDGDRCYRGVRSRATGAAVLVDNEKRGRDEGEPDCGGVERVQSSEPENASGT